MSIARERFLEIGGFDSSIVSSEDQDFALRHSARSGRIVFLPEAKAIHCDDSLDIRSYCRRAEWGSRHMIPFCLRYPDCAENIERHRINAPMKFGQEPLMQSLRKAIKSVLASKPVELILFAVAAFIERVAPNSATLDRTYRLLLGAHIFRGYREGLRRSPISDQQPGIKIEVTKGTYVEVDR
jgi:GT2 family glycosyltransferase